jgi:hypothetical protein
MDDFQRQLAQYEFVEHFRPRLGWFSAISLAGDDEVVEVIVAYTITRRRLGWEEGKVIPWPCLEIFRRWKSGEVESYSRHNGKPEYIRRLLSRYGFSGYNPQRIG